MKRIITCSDGTWNQPGSLDRGKDVETNVEKMYRFICHDGEGGIKQLKIYDQGVGTGVTKKDKILGGATGAGIDKNIKDVYTFICLNYEAGDELYLFGFSRGAYTARSIAGFIRNCGILKPSNINLVDKAYELYRDRNSYSSPDSDLMRAFKRNFSYSPVDKNSSDIRLKFIGVWDTVGSLGIPLPSYKLGNQRRYKFHDVTLSSFVDNAYHALAIDEKRALFEPTLWKQSKKALEDDHDPQVMEQRWFAGVHSNIGGGYVDSGLSDIALKWLIDKANAIGLCYDTDLLKEMKPNIEGELRNSYTAMYWLWRPRWRIITLNDDSNQTLDDSVKDLYKVRKKYRPKSLDDLMK